jgi:hypothetical protein
MLSGRLPAVIREKKGAGADCNMQIRLTRGTGGRFLASVVDESAAAVRSVDDVCGSTLMVT